MKEIIALQQYTDKHISLYEGEIRNIEDKLADQLIAKNIVAEHDQTSPSGVKYVKDDPSDNGGVIEGLVEGKTGKINVASGQYAHAEGANTEASGDQSHAEGAGTKALGNQSHAEGGGTTASGSSSHAEGGGSKAQKLYSHAEGSGTTASGVSSHAEGGGTTASGEGSHAEGGGTTASGEGSHAEGGNTEASGDQSHAEGIGTIAYGVSSHVQGKYNIQDKNNIYTFIIGNGSSEMSRSNAFAIKWDGTFVFANGTQITPSQFASLKTLLNT